MALPKVSETIGEMHQEFLDQRDREVQALSDVIYQYITDHNDRQAYRDADRQVAVLARALDRMIAFLAKAEKQARKIEDSVEGFYGD